MEWIALLTDFVFHIDKHLELFIYNHGAWVYALLFLIVFVETGVVVMPFLPGDSLLFIVGALCGVGLMNFPTACAVLIAAAVLGDQCNCQIGRYFGPRVFKWENSRFFNKQAFDRAHTFYETYGGITVVLARFLPFLRTFVPFVAGVAMMNRTRFALFNVLGALIWVLSICTAGYFLGVNPWVMSHLNSIILAMIIIPGVVVVWGALRGKRKPSGTT